MPLYEFKCKDCNKKFELFIKNIKSHKRNKCPHCDSSNLKKLFSEFSAANNNDSKTGGDSCSTGMCPFC